MRETRTIYQNVIFESLRSIVLMSLLCVSECLLFPCFKEITTNTKLLNDWVRLEKEKYISILEQRHHAEIDAFVEQMRLKDEKLESSRWQLLSMELESKRLQSHIEGLDENLSHFKEEIMKLELRLSERDKELKSLKENLSDYSLHCLHCKKSNSSDNTNHPGTTPHAIWSEVKIATRKLSEDEQDQEVGVVGISGEVEDDIQERGYSKAFFPSKSSEIRTEIEQKEKEKIDINTSNIFKEDAQVGIQEQLMKDLHLQREENSFEEAIRAPADDIEEEMEVCVARENRQEDNFTKEHEIVHKLPYVVNCLVKKNSPCKKDLHALGVSFKIKRLKQQLLMVEKLVAAHALKKPTGKSVVTSTSESCERWKMEEHGHQTRGFLLVISFLNKQVKRYQTLEERTDELCKRMVSSYTNCLMNFAGLIGLIKSVLIIITEWTVRHAHMEETKFSSHSNNK